MIPAAVVLDASAFIRAAEGGLEASEWIGRIESKDVSARAPDLVYAEAANALLVQSRAGRLDLEAAAAVLDVLRRLPIRVTSAREFAPAALHVAESRGLSAYDASYVVLAELADAALLTADRRLAAATSNSVLLD